MSRERPLSLGIAGDAAATLPKRARDADRTEALARRHADLGRLRIMDTLARDVTGPLDISLA